MDAIMVTWMLLLSNISEDQKLSSVSSIDIVTDKKAIVRCRFYDRPDRELFLHKAACLQRFKADLCSLQAEINTEGYRTKWFLDEGGLPFFLQCPATDIANL